MHIVMVGSEVAPFSKTGGLGDVMGALPIAFEKAGHKVTVFSPLHREVRENAEQSKLDVEPADNDLVSVPVGDTEEKARLVKGFLPGSGVPVFFLENDYYFDRSGLYVDPKTGEDYPDNSERYIFFCRGAMLACLQLGLQVDVLHAHDWQAGLVPTYHKHMYADDFAGAISAFTVHNVAFQGLFWHQDMNLTGLPWELFNWRQLEFFGNLSLLKAGLVNADLLTTVSKQYAQEIQTEDFGMNLEGIFRERNKDLRGIVNGVDYSLWNPEVDGMIPAKFSPQDLSGKAICKKELQEQFNLPRRQDAPLIGMIGRLVHQKGYDLVLEEIERIMDRNLQIVLLGKGEQRYRELLGEATRRYPDKFAVKLDFDEQCAHLIEAGADMFLMPSRFEPCGLNQLYSMKYATIPLVAATGGLVDTVRGHREHGKNATGFVFQPDSAEELVNALRMALDIYSQRPGRWREIMLNAMNEDWSWDRSAGEYLDFFREKPGVVESNRQ